MNLPKQINIKFIIISLLIAIPLAAYLLSPTGEIGKKVLPAATKSKKMSEKETKSLVDRVGKLIDLPKDELPTVATVANKFELPPQPFYRKAENSDVILIYFKAEKAILYRPSQNKIIEVSTVKIPTATPDMLKKDNTLTPSSLPELSVTPQVKSRILISPVR